MSTKTLKHTCENGQKIVKVQWVDDWEEYQVEIWIGGKLQSGATYHTDDFVDAILTAEEMVK